MPDSDLISCRQTFSQLATDDCNIDEMVLMDERPYYGGLWGYFVTGTFEPGTGTEHTVDRLNSVFPNLTNQWTEVNAAGCTTLCDCVENKIGWGWERFSYRLMKQCWGTDILCFDEISTKKRAKEHLSFIISEILRPSSRLIMGDFLARNAYEQAAQKVVVTTGLPPFTITWDAGGYMVLNTGAADPTGILTPQILQSFVRKQYFLGAINAGEKGFDHLELYTDMDTFRALCKDDPFLKSAYRFGEFPCDSENYYKYGLSGYSGDFHVRVDQWPWRFNKISPGKYQRVMPYKNVPTTEGIKSVFNDDYDKAVYQLSCIINRRALRVMPFRAESVNPEMPFLVRDYAGKWRFAMHDLGADCNGKPIDNTRQNKGKFFADFQLAIKPEHPEWLVAILHKVSKPCIVIIDTCNPDPGNPAQSYSSYTQPCPNLLTFTPARKADTTFGIAANTVRCEGNVITHAAVTTAAAATVAALATAIAAVPSLAALGTWAASTDGTKLVLSNPTCLHVELPFTL